jgi:hypothetical protein
MRDMRRSLTDTAGLRRRRALQAVAAFAVTSVLLGSLVADQIDDFIAFAMIVAAGVLPSALWVAVGGRGIPIIPVIALGHIVYFALPILRGSPAELGYDDAETLRAAFAVSLFLVSATLASQFITLRARREPDAHVDPSDGRELAQLMLGGLVVGIAYQVGLFVGALNWLGYYSGLARAVALTLVSAACYLLGVAGGRRQLSRGVLIAATIGLFINVVMTWMSLFLVGGIFFLLSVGLGYAISSARIPWRTALIGFVAVGVLHAGKQDMREKYWEERSNYSEYTSLPSLPIFMSEWVSAGVASILSGEVGKDISQRASLVWILLHVQRVAPTPIPFLDGATYALLPQMLVPRFLDPDKIPSQAGMNMLNVHFGILTEEDTQHTAVGWGPLAEGYGNFGYIGVAGAGFIIGVLGGALTLWSAGAPAVSLAALFAIAAMLQMANLEADMAYLFTSLIQSFVGVVIYFGVFRILARRRRRRSDPRVFAVPSPSRRR